MTLTDIFWMIFFPALGLTVSWVIPEFQNWMDARRAL